MGLYFRIHGKRNAFDEELMLDLYKGVLEQLIMDFRLRKNSKYILYNEFEEDKPLIESPTFDIGFFLDLIEKDRKDYRIKTGKNAHYSITVSGVIELENGIDKPELMIIDINGTCENIKDLYGNVWIDFYDAKEKWSNYFVGDKLYQENNRKKLYKLINKLKIPVFKLHSVFFAKSNLVFDLLNNAYYLYWREYKYFIEDVMDIIKDRIKIGALDYEDLHFSSDTKKIIVDIRKDLKLYNSKELINLIQSYIDYIIGFQSFISKSYKENLVSLEGSFEIKNKTMTPKLIRNVVTDFMGNFLNSLYFGLIRYEKTEQQLKNKFSTYEFTKQGSKYKESSLRNFIDKKNN